ncbi:MAG: ATP-dependent DNA helicase [Candidatus Micrarchaeia archaeon]
MEFLFRFNSLRPFQDKMLHDIYSSISKKRSILINAPTGIGKTDASISAALTYIIKEKKEHGTDLNLFFLTPKISQHAIAIESLRGIKDKYELDFKYIDFVGKQNLCTNTEVNNLESSAFYQLCNKKIKEGKCTFFNNTKNLISANNSSVPKEVEDSVLLGHNSLLDSSFNYKLCGYELAAHFAKSSQVIVADYIHMLNPSINASFMKKIGKDLSNSILIWDEAHNMLELASSYLESSLTLFSIENAQKELNKIGSTFDLDYLKFIVNQIADKKLSNKKEAFIEINDMPEESINDEIIESIEKAAIEYIVNEKAKRSSLMHIANFLKLFKNNDDSLIRIVSKLYNKPKIEVSCMYPKNLSALLNSSYANIFMSATLNPLNMYAEVFGIKNAVLESYASPFPKLNKKVIIDDSFTTKYEFRSIEEYKKIAARISEIKKKIPGNVAVFFPSFDVLEGVFRYINDEQIFLQRRNMHNVEISEILKKFSKSDKSMLFGVMGGSLSEGIDYTNNIIKGIIIVGLPFSNPDLKTAMKIKYFNKLFEGKGNEYVYLIPAIIRVIQASGRAIRSEKDRAVIVLMDKRYKFNTYKNIIKDSLPVDLSDSIDKIDLFWSESKEKAK